MEAIMKKTFLKKLFKKRKFDWESGDYLRRSLLILESESKFEIYKEKSTEKGFVEKFRNLLPE
jgi:hypothetical protein